MTSFELIREGEVTCDGRLVVPGAIVWADEPLPVIDNGRIVGKLTNLRREGNSVWGDTDVDAECVTVDSDQLSVCNDGSIVQITCARIRAGNVSSKDRFPWQKKTGS